MSVGLNPTKDQIDATAGDIARSIVYHLRRAENFDYFLASKTTQELVALGYTEDEVTSLKTGVSVLNALRKIFEGAQKTVAAVGVAPDDDMRTFPRRLIGMGDV